MTLEIKGESTKHKQIRLERSGDCISVRINNELIANFFFDGDFQFYGIKIPP